MKQINYKGTHTFWCEFLPFLFFNTSIASITVFRNLEIFDFVMFREVRINYYLFFNSKSVSDIQVISGFCQGGRLHSFPLFRREIF